MIIFQVPKSRLSLSALLLVPGKDLPLPDPLGKAVAHTGTVQHQADHHQHGPRYPGGLCNTATLYITLQSDIVSILMSLRPSFIDVS